jgi:hypothetical protein
MIFTSSVTTATAGGEVLLYEVGFISRTKSTNFAADKGLTLVHFLSST